MDTNTPAEDEQKVDFRCPGSRREEQSAAVSHPPTTAGLRYRPRWAGMTNYTNKSSCAVGSTETKTVSELLGGDLQTGDETNPSTGHGTFGAP